MPKNEWTITIGGREGFGGLCPGYTENSYPFIGRKNQGSDLTDIDIRDPNVLAPGPKITNLTGGDHTGELGENLIVSITKHATSDNVAYAISSDKVFKITSSSVSNNDYPLSLAGGTTYDATDLIYYKSNIYVFWNDTGVDGDIAKVTIATPEIDSDWGSTQDTELEDAPHYAIVAGDDVVYYTNGRYVGIIEDTTVDVQKIDFWENSEAVSLTWNNNRVKVAVNRPNVSGSNFNKSAIYTWNGVDPSWEGDPIEVSGEIGALYTKNGIDYVWWKDSTSTGGYLLGYIDGLTLRILRRYSGSLPNQAQVGEYDGFLAWLSEEKLMLFGAKDEGMALEMFPYLSTKHTTNIGGFAVPFGDPLVASEQNANFTASVDDTITSAGHGLSDGETVRLTTTNTLPAGLSTSTDYYVIEATTDTFKLSTEEGGDAVDITDTGTGTHTWHQYSLGKPSGYSTSADFKTIGYPVSGVNFLSQIDLIIVSTEQLSSGEKIDFTLTYDQGKSTQSLEQIAYSESENKTRHKILNKSYSVEDFRLDISWASSSESNAAKIRSIFIKGHYIPDT